MKEPKLRFKADGGMLFPDWEEKKIGELGAFTKGAPLSKADISECGTSLILYGELYTTYNEVAYDIQRKTQSTVDEKYYSHVGDVVIPTSGETAEEISTATCVMAQNVILAGDLNIYRSDIVDGRIMSYILNHQAKWKIAKLAQGKSVVHIQAAQLSGVAVKYPPSIVEQQKIASLFTELDNLIQSAQKELDGYRELKQGMLQKMFPKKGEKVPELRFPEFTGDWEEHELLEMFNYEQPSKYIVKNDNYEGCTKYPVLTANKGFILGYTDETEGIYNKGEVIIFDDFTCDHKFVNFSFKVKSSAIKILTPKDNYNLPFLSELLNVMNQQPLSHQRHWISVMQPSIVFAPSLEEQKKIGEYFSSLDNLIILQQKEIDGYKELKKGLLQQMFC